MRRHAPATGRNREPIAAVLAETLPAHGIVLEIAGGTGEHCAFLAARFPALVWQPSDPDAEARASIADWCSELRNVRAPLARRRGGRVPASGRDPLHQHGAY